MILKTGHRDPWLEIRSPERRRSSYQAQRISGPTLARSTIGSTASVCAVQSIRTASHCAPRECTRPPRDRPQAQRNSPRRRPLVRSIMPRKYPVNVSHWREMLGVDLWRGAAPLPYAHRPFCTSLSRTVASNSDARSYRVVHRSNHSVSCFLAQRTSPVPRKVTHSIVKCSP
jgi:hypothetical protein